MSTYGTNGQIEDGELGPVYGRSASGRVLMAAQLIRSKPAGIRNNPDSRRHIVKAWNVAEVNNCCPMLPFFQFYVVDGKLSRQLYQRSADIFLGVPFNIASKVRFSP